MWKNPGTLVAPDMEISFLAGGEMLAVLGQDVRLRLVPGHPNGVRPRRVLFVHEARQFFSSSFFSVGIYYYLYKSWLEDAQSGVATSSC